MKTLSVMIFVFSLSALGQTIDPGTMGGSVGTLNQVTKETDGTGTLNQQEQQDVEEQQYQEQRLREQKEWEEEKNKTRDEYRFDVPDK